MPTRLIPPGPRDKRGVLAARILRNRSESRSFGPSIVYGFKSAVLSRGLDLRVYH